MSALPGTIFWLVSYAQRLRPVASPKKLQSEQNLDCLVGKPWNLHASPKKHTRPYVHAFTQTHKPSSSSSSSSFFPPFLSFLVAFFPLLLSLAPFFFACATGDPSMRSCHGQNPESQPPQITLHSLQSLSPEALHAQITLHGGRPKNICPIFCLLFTSTQGTT